MKKITNLFQYIFRPTSLLSERDLAIIALFFPFAYFLELAMSRAQKQDISAKAIFAFWFILTALRYPKLYPISLLAASAAFIASGIIQGLNYDRFTSIGAQAGFGFIIMAILQMYILEWQEKQKK